MRLLFVHDHPFYIDGNKFYSGGGLPARTWKNYLINFDKVFVFGRKSYDLKDKKVLSSSQDNVEFCLTTNYSSITSLLRNYKNLKEELFFLIDQSDIVLVRLPSILGLLAAFIAFQKNKKTWVEMVGNAKESLNSHGSILGMFFAPFFDWLNRRVVNRANYVIYVTKSNLQSSYPPNESAITTSISNVIIQRVLSNDLLNTNRFNEKRLKIGLIGGFGARYKGQDVLLKAINLLPLEVKTNIELYFIGIGNPDWILNLADELGLKENIKFIGSKVSGEPILNLLEKMSLYIQPSLTEGMPRALLEAMSMGCPVMGSIVGGIPDVVNANLLHIKGDYKTVRTQLERLFYNRQELVDESLRSLSAVKPYLKSNLDNKRMNFYKKINKDFGNE